MTKLTLSLSVMFFVLGVLTPTAFANEDSCEVYQAESQKLMNSAISGIVCSEKEPYLEKLTEVSETCSANACGSCAANSKEIKSALNANCWGAWALQ